MQVPDFTEEYNTTLFTYHGHRRCFKGKLRKLLLDVMKNEPDRLFTVNELTKLMLIKDGQEPIIQPQHSVSVRGVLKHWLTKGVVERIAFGTTNVRWKLKSV